MYLRDVYLRGVYCILVRSKHLIGTLAPKGISYYCGEKTPLNRMRRKPHKLCKFVHYSAFPAHQFLSQKKLEL